MYWKFHYVVYWQFRYFVVFFCIAVGHVLQICSTLLIDLYPVPHFWVFLVVLPFVIVYIDIFIQMIWTMFVDMYIHILGLMQLFYCMLINVFCDGIPFEAHIWLCIDSMSISWLTVFVIFPIYIEDVFCIFLHECLCHLCSICVLLTFSPLCETYCLPLWHILCLFDGPIMLHLTMASLFICTFYRFEVYT